MSNKKLSGKVAFVVGASRRAGRLVALGLAQDGVKVVISARESKEELESLVAEIRSAGGEALSTLMDIESETSVKDSVQTIREKYGRLDLLVNNAAIRKQSPLLEMTLDEWQKIMRINLDGVFLTCRESLPLMIESGGGAIVNIGGVTAHIGVSNRAHVAAAKAGIVGFTKALAVEFADRNIRANCVVPGKIGGERSQTSGASPIDGSRIILKREGTPEEAAEVIRFLCQPGAGFMTGQTVHVSGGLYMP